MTANGLYINAATGEPEFTPHPVAKPLPPRWGLNEPRSVDGDAADAIVRHRGAWCHVYEYQGWDAGGGTTECNAGHGIVGSSYRRDMTTQRCGDVP